MNLGSVVVTVVVTSYGYNLVVVIVVGTILVSVIAGKVVVIFLVNTVVTTSVFGGSVTIFFIVFCSNNYQRSDVNPMARIKIIDTHVINFLWFIFPSYNPDNLLLKFHY